MKKYYYEYDGRPLFSKRTKVSVIAVSERDAKKWVTTNCGKNPQLMDSYPVESTYGHPGYFTPAALAKEGNK